MPVIKYQFIYCSRLFRLLVWFQDLITFCNIAIFVVFTENYINQQFLNILDCIYTVKGFVFVSLVSPVLLTDFSLFCRISMTWLLWRDQTGRPCLTMSQPSINTLKWTTRLLPEPQIDAPECFVNYLPWK